MYIAYQIGAYQAFAYQTVTGIRSVDQNLLGGKDFSYVTAYQKHEKDQREKIRKEKFELQKVESVLQETERKKDLVARNRQSANKAATLRLLKLENEYLEEINRLLAVRAELMKRIAEDETILIILMMKRRKLRVA